MQRKGEVIKQTYGRACGVNDPFVAETLGCREAISWLKCMGAQRDGVVLGKSGLVFPQINKCYYSYE